MCVRIRREPQLLVPIAGRGVPIEGCALDLYFGGSWFTDQANYSASAIKRVRMDEAGSIVPVNWKARSLVISDSHRFSVLGYVTFVIH
ncbi:hypothetical protein WN55_06794 [Dufourea novaeangliae]|uniref:Uncharacterized protein n=1 Tax=Dufourea novaeangliae TaxID=178035 RepID=A0A154PR42_DUFNO|nr:hypothetical protein WN55_06794 [Dufourea novaeangliae]